MDSSSREQPKFDLEERTTVFAENCIEHAFTLPQNAITRPLISQFVRASTSVGANYCEANDAESKKDFRHKIALCRKESRETKYWLRLLKKACPRSEAAGQELWQEAKELNLIFSKIFRSCSDV